MVFDHWRHRSRYTCRLCHVDIGFAMTANGTGIRAADNAAGYHCGACHDLGDPVTRRQDFEAFAGKMPRGEQTGEIDWDAAEAARLVRPVDELPGMSIPRKPLAMDMDVTIKSMGRASNVIFSDRKHAVWNGCEVCHPDIYPNQ